jgi:hypothetical protein
VIAPQSLNRYSYVMNNPALYVDPYGYFPPSLGDVVDGARRAAGAAGGAIRGGAEAVGGGVAAGAEWLGEDYHWATVGAAVGGTAFAGGVVLLTGGAAAPILTTALLSGGLGVGVPLTALSVAHSGKECAGGDNGACVSAAVGGVPGPLGFVPGGTGLFFEWLPALTDVGISLAERALELRAQAMPPKE